MIKKSKPRPYTTRHSFHHHLLSDFQTRAPDVCNNATSVRTRILIPNHTQKSPQRLGDVIGSWRTQAVTAFFPWTLRNIELFENSFLFNQGMGKCKETL